MAVTVECDACRRAYTVADHLAGQRVRCKNCANVFTIAPPAPSLAEFSAGEDDPFAQASFRPTTETTPPEQTAKWKLPPVSLDYVAPSTPALVDDAISRPGESPAFAEPNLERRSNSVGVDTATPYIILLFLAISVIAGIWLTVQVYSHAKDSNLANSVVGHLWGWIVAADVLFFALVAPFTLGGIWLTSKILRFPMVDSPYLRACGVATLPMLIFYLANVLPLPLALLALVGTLPVTFYMLKMVFELKWAESFLSFVLGGIGWVVGWLGMLFVLGLIVASSALTLQREDTNRKSAQVAQQSSVYADPVMPIPDRIDPVDTALSLRIARFKERVQQATSEDISQSTREETEPRAEKLTREMESLRPTAQRHAEWPDLEQQVTDFQKKVDALPSGKLDSALFTESPGAEDWTTTTATRGLLGEEVSFKDFKFSPTLNARLDLQSSEDSADGLIWTDASIPAARLSISLRPRNDQKQIRVVVSDKPAVLRIAENAGLYSVNSPAVHATYGQINGIPFTRIANGHDDHADRQIDYIAPANEHWLILHVTLPATNDLNARALEAAARTIRRADPTEAKADPFAPKYVAQRLADDYQTAATLLRAKGALAEDAVVELLQSDNAILKNRALQLLKEIGTEKSLPALRIATQDSDPTIAALAREVCRKIKPDIASAIPRPTPPANPDATIVPDNPPAPPAAPDSANTAQMFTDLASDDAGRRKEAVDRLAFATP